MTQPFLLTSPASRDLDDILNYVALNSTPVGAQRLYEKLKKAFFMAGRNPEMGYMRTDLTTEPIRIIHVFSYLVLYRPETKPVQIIRILHGARDVTISLLEDN